MVNDDDDVKALSCKRCGGLLASLEFVLYRVPPYLVIQWGFEQLRKQAKLQMFDDLIVPNTSPWRSNPKEDIYRWAGLIMLTNINHFELYRRTDEGGVQHVQDLRHLRKQRITSLDYWCDEGAESGNKIAFELFGYWRPSTIVFKEMRGAP